MVGTDWRQAEGILRRHLDAQGLRQVNVRVRRGTPATRLDPDDPWARWAVASLAATTGKTPALLPNLGGTVPNDAFSDVLGLPTVWVPHSYPACCQHGPDAVSYTHLDVYKRQQEVMARWALRAPTAPHAPPGQARLIDPRHGAG